jgi:hypothetical protein
MNVNEHFIVRSITKKLEFLEISLKRSISFDMGKFIYSCPVKNKMLVKIRALPLLRPAATEEWLVYATLHT